MSLVVLNYLGVTFGNVFYYGNFCKYDDVDAWHEALMCMHIPVKLYITPEE